ncbi:MAG: transposase [Clostridia bacterium]|nr:transposase [Clostridia bacterium]
MYYDFTVKTPVVRGKIIVKKKGAASYVLFEYGRDYFPDKRYAVPKRAIIGKIAAEDGSLMYPNEKYQEYFPDAVMPEERPEAYRSCCLRIGSYIVIRKVLQEYDLTALLEKRLHEDTGLFLDLMAYMIVDEENAGQYYPDFAFCHPLFSDGMRIYSDVKVSRMLSSIRREQIIGFLDDWNSKRDHRQRIYISYDSTNKNCQTGDVDIVEFGKAKDEKGLPVFNLAIAFDKTNRIPLFYEEYPGSITDVSQFTFMVDKVKEYRYKKIGFVLDRGYFSKGNIQYMDANRYTFIIMVKGCRDLVSSLVLENLHTFETDRDCSIRAYRVYGKTVKGRLYEDDAKDRYFHIYFNASKQAAEREQLEQRLEKFGQFLGKHTGEEIRFGATYQKYFKLNYDRQGRFLYAEEKSDVIQQELELCGYFCIITSEKMTAGEALVHYKGRDMSEKLFKTDKTFIGSRSMRVQTSESISAKIFVEFIALIVRNRIYNLLKETMLRLDAKPNYMTVPAALRELEKIEMVRRSSGQYRLDHAVTKRQKVILSAFGLDADDVQKEAAEIGRLMAERQSLITMDTEEGDDEDGTDEIDTVY